VRAFALIEDQTHGKRGVAIGKTSADKSGRFMLLLPPSIQRGW